MGDMGAQSRGCLQGAIREHDAIGAGCTSHMQLRCGSARSHADGSGRRDRDACGAGRAQAQRLGLLLVDVGITVDVNSNEQAIGRGLASAFVR